MHSLVVGMTESGKSLLVKRMCKKWSVQKKGILVLDPLGDDWVCDWQTDDPDLFNQAVYDSRNCVCICDECSNYLQNSDREYHWWGTQSRHKGHDFFFITQRANQLAVNVRTQAKRLYMFHSSLKDCETLRNEWNRAELMNGHLLKQFQYYKVPRFGAIEKRMLF